MQSVIVGELCMHKARFESRDHLLPQNGVMLHHGYPKLPLLLLHRAQSYVAGNVVQKLAKLMHKTIC